MIPSVSVLFYSGESWCCAFFEGLKDEVFGRGASLSSDSACSESAGPVPSLFSLISQRVESDKDMVSPVT